MKAPCKDCQDRAVGCHGQCARYAEFEAERDKIRRKKADDALGGELVSVSYYRVQKLKRKSRW